MCKVKTELSNLKFSFSNMEVPYSKGIRDGLAEIFRREDGSSLPRNFARRFSSSEAIVKRLDLYGKLIGHEGCVNAVEFNSTGDLLVSGSDDRNVIFWDWAANRKLLSYQSGHSNNIFQTRIMPLSDDRRIVTSAADGQIRLGQVSEGGQVHTKKLGKHQGCVFKLALEPGSPHIFYSCGEDGFVQHFDLRSGTATRLFYCSAFPKDNKRRPNSVRLNAIVIDPTNPNYFAIGGSDEYARVYDIRKCRWDSSISSDPPVNTFSPRHLINNDNVHITGLAYSNSGELLVSYNDELIYLFEKKMGMGPSPFSVQPDDLHRLDEPQVYSGHRNARTVKGVNFFGPNDEYVLSGSDCGHIFIWKKKGAKLVRMMPGDRHVVNQLEPHPYMPFFATCGIEKTVKIWVPMGNEAPPVPNKAEKIMESNRQGMQDHSRVTLTPDVIMHVLRLQRRQTLAYVERRHSRDDIEHEDDEGEALILQLGDSDASSDDEGGNTRECSIS